MGTPARGPHPRARHPRGRPAPIDTTPSSRCPYRSLLFASKYTGGGKRLARRWWRAPQAAYTMLGEMEPGAWHCGGAPRAERPRSRNARAAALPPRRPRRRDPPAPASALMGIVAIVIARRPRRERLVLGGND